MILVTNIQLHSTTLLDFAKLKAKGWVRPRGFFNKELHDSLVKKGKIHTYQIVTHDHRDGSEYQQIFFHPSENYNKVLLKGTGTGLPLHHEIKILEKLIRELETCTKEV